MGLFNRGSDAEKKLKKITGGLILNSDYISKLKDNGLDVNDGVKIKNQVKEEIKQGKLGDHDVRVRINQLIKEYSKSTSSIKKTCPQCGESQDSSNTFCINCGYELSNDKSHQIECPNCGRLISESSKVCPYCHKKVVAEKTCPICNQKQDEANAYCISCGYDFVNRKSSPKKKRCPNCNRELFDKTMLCPYCNYDFESKQVRESKKVSKSEDPVEYKIIPKNLDFIRKTRFLNTFDFNLKTCPECNTSFLKSDPYCFNCGSSVLTPDTVKNDNVEVKNGKLVEKSDLSSNDELSDLEALYSHAVQSRYAPDFRIVYVLYLNHLKKNPSKKFPDRIVKNYETTHNKLKKQAIEDEFIEPASPLTAAADFKVSDLKEILKEYNLKVSGKKSELIERLGENLSEDELKKHFKSKNYQISAKGIDFLNNNRYILYVTGDEDISKVIAPVEYGKIFKEEEYSCDEIREKLLAYLTEMQDKKLSSDDWGEYRIYSNAIAQILEDKNNLTEALNIRFKVFLFDLNNYSVYLKKPEPSKTRLKQKDVVKLNELLHKLSLPLEELKDVFESSYNEVLFKTLITSQDSLIYLLKVFGGENLDALSSEINKRYSNPY